MTDDRWFAAHLQPGERILWQGRPGHRPFWTNENAPIIILMPLSSVFLGAIGTGLYFMLTHGLHRQPAALLATFALMLPLIVYLLYIGFLQWLLPRMTLRRTAYVITDKRILRKRGHHIDALDAFSLPDVTLRPEKDGHGSLLFGRHPMEATVGYGRNAPEFVGVRRESFALWHVPEAKEVLSILRTLDSKGGAA